MIELWAWNRAEFRLFICWDDSDFIWIFGFFFWGVFWRCQRMRRQRRRGEGGKKVVHLHPADGSRRPFSSISYYSSDLSFSSFFFFFFLLLFIIFFCWLLAAILMERYVCAFLIPNYTLRQLLSVHPLGTPSWSSSFFWFLCFFFFLGFAPYLAPPLAPIWLVRPFRLPL